MHFRQIANPQMKMARLKSGDLQPLCKMRSPSSFFPGNFVSRHSFLRGQSIPRQTTRRRELRSSSFPFAVPIALMKKAFLAGVDEEGVVDSSIARCVVLLCAASSKRAREVVAAWRETARSEEKSPQGGTENPVISICIAGLLWHICQVSPSKCIAM